MERRAYFIAGDLLACVVAGAAAGWLTQLVVPMVWFVPIGMIAGMAVGMAAGMIAGFLFSPLFGFFEVMLPASLSGILAGMWIGMEQTMAVIGPSGAAADGVVVGVLSLALTYFMQSRLQGEVVQ